MYCSCPSYTIPVTLVPDYFFYRIAFWLHDTTRYICANDENSLRVGRDVGSDLAHACRRVTDKFGIYILESLRQNDT